MLSRTDALRSLVEDYGAHIIPITDDKRPQRGYTQWHRRSWSWDELRGVAARTPVALVPASLGMSVLDWDDDDLVAASDFTSEYTPTLIVPSRTEGRWHFYYDDTESRGSGAWAWGGRRRGEVRSGRGYVGLWGYAPQMLHRLLHTADTLPASVSPPWDELMSSCDDVDDTDATAAPRAASDRIAPGWRNNGIFDAVRHWAYRAVHDYTDYGSWLQAVRTQAYSVRSSVDVESRGGYSRSECAATAKSIAMYVWARRDEQWASRVSSAQQSWRGRRSGESRRWHTRTRDAEILALASLGISQRAIARHMGLHRRVVQHVIHR